ncbi:hypothetical protein [Mongoliimonas terrestris]|uniref:hypothetical protein n=1 Tax=Mongoliimonas terrestris TaxID=1709001 RepID=UPI000A529B67|nr:hypothetical protein [Mongoliimonas terrestris]
MGFFRGLMVPISFLLFLALFGATALAVIAGGPLSQGVQPADLPTLLPTGAGAPNPFVIAAGLALVADLFIGMIAMLISEKVTTVGSFLSSLLKTTFWFGLLFAGGLAFYLNGLEGDVYEKFLPAALLFAGLIAAAVVSGIVLGLPFLWWVSERPRQKRRRTVHRPRPAPVPTPVAAPVAVEPLAPEPQHPSSEPEHAMAEPARPSEPNPRETPPSPAGAPPPPAA